MKKKFLLPVMAMVVAIGMSFATERSTADPEMDYYLENGVFIPIGAELDCGVGTLDCLVQIEENGVEHPVFDAAAPGTEKNGSSGTIEFWRTQN